MNIEQHENKRAHHPDNRDEEWVFAGPSAERIPEIELHIVEAKRWVIQDRRTDGAVKIEGSPCDEGG